MSEDQQLVSTTLQSYFPIIVEEFNLAMEEYHKIPVLHKFEARTKAGALRDLCASRLESRFSGNPNVQIIRKGQLFLVRIKEICYLRVKKLNNNLKTNVSSTRQGSAFSNQICLFDSDITERSMNLNLGYVMSLDWGKMQRIAVVCPNGRSIEWSIDITPYYSNSQVNDTDENPVSNKKEFNIRIKPDVVTKKSSG